MLDVPEPLAMTLTGFANYRSHDERTTRPNCATTRKGVIEYLGARVIAVDQDGNALFDVVRALAYQLGFGLGYTNYDDIFVASASYRAANRLR